MEKLTHGIKRIRGAKLPNIELKDSASIVREGLQRGFSLIELLVTLAIIGVLAGLAINGFSLYRDHAEFAKGQVTYSHGRMALGAGELSVPENTSIAMLFTGVAGGPVPPLMEPMMPGMTTTKDLQLGAALDTCDPGDDDWTMSQSLTISPCKATHGIRWFKFCNGFEVYMDNGPALCP